MNLAKRLLLAIVISVVGIIVLGHFLSSPKQVTVVVLNKNHHLVEKQADQPLNTDLKLATTHTLPKAIDPVESEAEIQEIHEHLFSDNIKVSLPNHLPDGVKVDVDGNVFLNNTILIRKEMVGYMNVDIWTGVEGFLVDDLRLEPQFPKNPTNAGKLTSLYNSFGMDFDEYGEKIYGYIIPSKTGPYRFAVASDDASEIWLSSDHQPKNLKKIACLACMDVKDIPPLFPPAAPPSFSAESNFKVHPKQISPEMNLEALRPYYIEILHKEGTEADYVNVNWQIPGSEELTGVPRNQFAMAKYLKSHYNSDKDTNMIPPPLKGPYPSSAMQRPMKIPYIGNDYRNFTILTDVLPECEYSPSYVSEHEVSRYTGFKEILQSVVYPDDHTWHKNGRHDSEGNPLIEEEEMNFVKNKFIEAIKNSKHGSKYDDLKLRLLESTPNVKEGIRNGWRYMMDTEIYWKGHSTPSYISQYIYRKEDKDNGPDLCLIKGQQWNREAHVNIIVTVKNIGRWVRHLIRNMEDIYMTTLDDHFSLIICDFESTDLNISQALKESRLKPSMYKLIRLNGTFRKTLALQSGLDWVANPNEIAMTLDLHLTLPIGVMQSIRKHTIRGHMGYAPQVFRLGPAFTEHNIQGYWETMGYGLLALYKSDWQAIGGQNVKEFSDKWGGEDWETIDRVQAHGLETFRHRYPGLVHYYHSHKGMWAEESTFKS